MRLWTRSGHAAVIPFRWDVTRRERLGHLVRGRAAESYEGFLDDLRACCARVVRAVGHLGCRAGGADVLFVGRSPESLYDYLRGVCWRTSWFDRLRMFHVSIGGTGLAALRREYPAGLAAFRAYLAALRLDPVSLRERGRPAVLVDLVCNGHTFANLVEVLRGGCVERGVCWHAARRNVRLVGITRREVKSPGAYRWHLHGPGIDWLDRGAARSVPAPERFWDYVGNRQEKVAESYPPAEWGGERVGQPLRSTDHAPALRLAVRLFETGRGREERARFVGALAGIGGLRLAELRGLASELRGD